MKCVRKKFIYTLNVMFQVHVTFQIYLVFKNTWRTGAIILLSKKNCGIPYSFLPSLFINFCVICLCYTYYGNLEQLYLKDMLAFVVYLK
jgi:hypothetical protein